MSSQNHTTVYPKDDSSGADDSNNSSLAQRTCVSDAHDSNNSRKTFVSHVSEVDDSNYSSSEKTFVLPKRVEFGYLKECSHQVKIVDKGLKAEKKDPTLQYAHGVVYGAKKLRGTVEFEVKILSYGTGWSGTLKIGVMKCKTGTDIEGGNFQIPRYSPEAAYHCVWSSDKVHNRLNIHNIIESSYGKRNLDELREGDHLGMRLTNDGVLVFFVNGINQGIAAENVYEKGHDLYVVVDHYANGKSTEITRAVMEVDINLQGMCITSLSNWLKSEDDVNTLPLPKRIRERLVQLIKD